MEWKNLEENVRRIATNLWNRQAVSKVINGVQIDCVVEKNDSYMYLVEITTENSLEKVRKDIAKLDSVACGLRAEDIYAEKFIVTKFDPTPSMRTTGAASKIKVLSVVEFEKMWFDFSDYIFRREKQPFGSVINIDTGLPEDDVDYIPVRYRDSMSGRLITIEELSEKLVKGNKIILKGSFGTGKSRCVKQLFSILSSRHTKEPLYTLAFNLKEHWGAKTYRELIQRHFEDLSLDPDNFKKVFDNKNIIYLLDGFDEIGVQSWSADPDKMHSLRKHAVQAISDLVQRVYGGCLITGREHYFNSDKEMLECLGLDKNALIFECAEEFEQEQIENYFKEITKEKIDYLPQWLPKRPLIMSIAIRNMKELFTEQHSLVNECDFWNKFLNLLAKREAKINPLLHDESIKNIMIRVARKSRIKSADFGPISLLELNKAFEEVTGERPNEETAILLHRLPGLGRIDANTSDRTFVDSYILNGLRAEDIIQIVNNDDKTITDEVWINPLNEEGLRILSSYLEYDDDRLKSFLSVALRTSKSENQVFVADVIASISMMDLYDSFDFRGIVVKNTRITFLDLSNKYVKNLIVENVWIDKLDITNVSFEKTTMFTGCQIINISGVSNSSGLPSAFQKCEYSKFQEVSTTSIIRRAKLSRPQTIFVIIVKKVFSTITKGNGRKEEALLRGLGDKSDSKLCDKILNKLVNEDILRKHKGREGWIYSPNLKYTERMLKILSDLTNSKDALWEFVTNDLDK